MRETVPDWVVREANEVVMVDLTPRALLNRLERGVVYAPEKASQALKNFFKEPTLVALRELALRQTAHEVETRQAPQPETSAAAGESASSFGARERILIHVTDDPSTAALIRRGRRVADYLNADCFAVSILRDGGLPSLPPKQHDAIEQHLNFARNLHIETRVLEGEDVAATLVDFARVHQITHIFVARPQNVPKLRLGRSMIQRIVRLAEDMQVTVVAERRRTAA
jgi:two-component system, OmpR family, sensor histidine kinase KdpD